MWNLQKLSNMFQLFHMYFPQYLVLVTSSTFYLITCKNCLEQYAGSSTNFKKSHIKTNKDERM